MKYYLFLDESGDHGLTTTNPEDMDLRFIPKNKEPNFRLALSRSGDTPVLIFSAKFATFLDVSSLETLSSDYGKMSDVNVMRNLSFAKHFAKKFI